MDAVELPVIPLPGRRCGSCAVCCRVVPVPELVKPAGVACRYLLARKTEAGCCGVYDARPRACAVFACSWLDGLGDALQGRPDRLGVMLEAGTKPVVFPGLQKIHAGGELRPGAMEQGAEAALARWLPSGEAAIVTMTNGDVRMVAADAATLEAAIAWMASSLLSGDFEGETP